MAGRNSESTTRFGCDIAELKAGMKEARRQIRLANSEFKAATAGMDDWGKSADGISAKLKQLDSVLTGQNKQLELLEDEYRLVVQAEGENSKGAEELMIKINNQKAAIAKTENQLSSYKEKLESIERENERTETAFTRLSRVTEKQQKDLEELKNKYASAVIVSGRMSAESRELARQIDELSRELQENRTRMEEAQDEADSLDNTLNDVEESTQEATGGFTVMKGIVADLAASAIKKAVDGLKNLAGEAVKTGANFSKAMSEVKAISGANGKDFEKLKNTAREYGATTVFSASESAEALKYMALAGWDAKKSSEALGGILDLAAASGMDLAKSSDLVTDYLSAFGMKAKDSAYFADLLAYAQGNSNTSAEQLGEAYKNCAANLSAAGQDVETTTSLLAAMANQGLKGAEGGTALAAMMRDLTKKMTQVKDKTKLAKLEQDGFVSSTGNMNDMLKRNVISVGKTLIAVSDAKGKYRDMTDILKDVEKATKGMGSAEKAAALSSTFTSDSIKGLNLILKQGIDKTAIFEKKLRKADGTAKKMSDTMNDNLTGDTKQFQSAMEEVSLKIYDILEPAMRDVVKWTTEITTDFSKWLENKENKKKIDELGKQLGNFVKNGLSNVKDFVKWFLDNKDDVINGISGIIAGFVAFKTVNTITSAVQAFQRFKGSIEGATAAQKLFNLALKANPAAIAAIGIGVLTTALLKHAKATKDTKDKTYELTEEEKKNKKSVDKLAEAYKKIKEAKEKSVADTQAEFGYYSDLKKELDKIVDKNGKIKKGYKDRASFIVNELNKAIGTELSISDDVIENYKEEKKQLNKLLETKKAQIILNANEEAYTEAIKNKSKAFSDMSAAQNNYTKTSQELADAQKYLAECESKLGGEHTYMYENYDRMVEAQKVVDELTQKHKDQEKTLKKAKNTYTEYNIVIENYEGLSSAIISEDTKKINSSLDNMINNFVTAKNGTKEVLEKQVKDMKKKYKDLQKAVEEGVPGVTKEMVESAKEMVEKSKKEVLEKELEYRKKHYEDLQKEAEKGTSAVTKEEVKSAKEMVEKTEKELNKLEGKTKEREEKKRKQRKKVLEEQLKFAKKYYEDLQKEEKKGTSGVTKEAVKSAKEMVKKAEKELNKFKGKAKKAGEKAGKANADGIKSKSKEAEKAAQQVAEKADKGLKKAKSKDSGVNFVQGFVDGINKKANDGTVSGAVAALASKTIEWLNIKLDIHSPSRIAFIIGSFFTEGFANGIRAGITKAKEAVEKLAKESIKKTATISIGEKMAKEIVEGIKKQKSNVKKSAEELSKIYVSTAKTKADTLSKNNKLNLAQEINFWKEIVKATKKGTNARLQAEKELAKAKKSYANECKKIDKEYLENVKKVNTQLKEDIQSVIDKYDEQVKSRKESIVSEMSLFDAFESSTEYSSEKLIENLKTQVQAIEGWDSALDNLEGRKIVPKNLIEELQSMGVGSLANIKLLDDMSDEELKEYVRLWKEKNKLAQERAEQENEGLKKSTQKQIKSLIKTANAELNTLEKEYNKKLKAIGESAMDQSRSIGKNIVSGLKKGMKSETSSFQKYLNQFFSSITSTAKNALKIHSPSGIMSDKVGKYIPLGIAKGISQNKDAITKAMQVIKSDLANPIKIDTSLAKQRIASGNSSGNYASSGSVTKVTNNYEFKQYNSSPKALTRLEIYRQTRNLTNFNLVKGV
ncbi:MAG: phage tail tape measure protein [Lachnospiraceae bacterium]|nr:phage tail tape measure protein [Lachnospiraceae bacterium]